MLTFWLQNNIRLGVQYVWMSKISITIKIAKLLILKNGIKMQWNVHFWNFTRNLPKKSEYVNDFVVFFIIRTQISRLFSFDRFNYNSSFLHALIRKENSRVDTQLKHAPNYLPTKT